MSDGTSAGSAQRDWREVVRDRSDGTSAGAAHRECCRVAAVGEGRRSGL